MTIITRLSAHFQQPPFVQKKYDEDGNFVGYEGYCIDLIKEIKKKMEEQVGEANANIKLFVNYRA